MKKKNFLVSILIINYNNSKLIKKAVLSCINQDYPNIEILVFDDQSSDNSLKVIKEISKKKNIKFFINKNKKTNIPAFDAKNGYYFLIKKSKGDVIFLLDSDDSFHKNKVSEVVKIFKDSKRTNFLQNLANAANPQNNNILSYWPFFAPESCISFRRKFINNFIKKNRKLENKFQSVWLGFRLGIYAYFIEKSFYSLRKGLTFYKSYGESKKYPRFGLDWFKRRLESFDYLYLLSGKKLSFKLNYDFFITFIIIKINKFFEKKYEKKDTI